MSQSSRSTEPSAAAFDRAALDAIRALDEGGAAGLLQQVVQLYLESAPRLIAELRRAGADGDATAVRNAAHSLKSSSANVGAVRLAEMCKAIEHAARAGVLRGDLPSVEDIEREFEALRPALEREAGRAA
ncbi:MAG TPA: Hpt domain-containing protein [Burkholderiales bacterium]|nr:Hpt domain-containing protein [Burkholderiales bacterium]